MESFDQSLKYLLQHRPEAFLQFGLGDPTIQVLGPLPSDLPARGRDIDGSYLIVRDGTRTVAHLEFHRRHQGSTELSIDIAEAQIRLYRRERLPVLSQVWDLYGAADEPVVTECGLRYGASLETSASQAIYQRINLRALGWEELLSQAPFPLWPLVTLTRNGADQEVVREACGRIETKTELSPGERADYLAVLWFVAEAEDVPTRLLKMYISEERLMASELYQSIFSKGEAKGEATGEIRIQAETVIRILSRRLGVLEPAVREWIRLASDRERLGTWYDMALVADDAEAANRLVETIRKAQHP
ncbi:hypothetical protein [Polyangium jinanense]|uniref:Uncharacterized protein n=1 Tax=Polyangium jinanense TaxID=2829994 RepID=A0A9X3X301_9BACT|nr:hypothetical protein [Polyangium jinanense]MDC3954209.1 hypothetical protein [Polyangium jinanense]MDC3981835.1 hypothetical protein [Polyangium jinanense]